MSTATVYTCYDTMEIVVSFPGPIPITHIERTPIRSGQWLAK